MMMSSSSTICCTSCQPHTYPVGSRGPTARSWRTPGHNPLSYSRLLSIAIVFALLCSHSVVRGAPIIKKEHENVEHQISTRQVPPPARSFCQYHQQQKSISCSFYETCIEPSFRCGSAGFPLGYGLPRCQASLLMRHSNDSCSHCLKNNNLVNWALKTEQCFQSRLQKLAELKRNEQPNSQSCLKYEEDAFRSLKACYDENHPALCSSFQYNAPTSDDMKDLTKIIDSFSVNDYYRPLVTEELTDLITKCGSTDDAAPFDLSYPPVRVFFCAVVKGEDTDIDTSMLEHAMSSSLGGGDVSLASEKLFASKCGDISPPSAYVGSRTDFRLVQWLPQHATDIDNLRSYYTAPITDRYKEVIFFKYDDYETQCGNGLREAGESCDLFGDNGSSEGGCSDMCQVIPNYECTTDQLERSYCYRTQCGDGIKSLDEECDDNNTLSNDGCSNKCTVETDYHCTTNYNETSLCQQRLLLIAPSSTHLISDVSSSSAPLSSQSVPIRTNEPSQPLQVSSSNSLVYRLHWVTVLLSVVISCWLLIR